MSAVGISTNKQWGFGDYVDFKINIFIDINVGPLIDEIISNLWLYA